MKNTDCKIYIVEGLYKNFYIGNVERGKEGKRFKFTYALQRDFNTYHIVHRIGNIKPISKSAKILDFPLPEEMFRKVRENTNLIKSIFRNLHSIDKSKLMPHNKDIIRKGDYLLFIEHNDYSVLKTYYIFVDNVRDETLCFMEDENGNWNVSKLVDKRRVHGKYIELNFNEFSSLLCYADIREIMEYAKLTRTFVNVAEIVTGIKYNLDLPIL